MNCLKVIFRFYVYANFHVAIAIWCLVSITGEIYGIDTFYPALILSLATFVSYNGIRYVKFMNKALQLDLARWFSHHKTILLCFNLIACVLLLYLLRYLSLPTLFFLVPFTVLTTLYIIPSSLRINLPSLRSVPSLKIFCISISWGLLVSLFPLVSASVPLGFKEVLFGLHQILFVFVLCLPFDIRDIDFDSRDLKTIPQLLGVHFTIYAGLIILLCIFLIEWMIFNTHQLLVSMVPITILSLLLFLAKCKPSHYFASFWVEAIPIFWFLTFVFLS